MGQYTLASIPHDLAHRIEDDPSFGARLIRAIMGRRNPNTPESVPEVHSVQLGPQFHSHDTFVVSVEEGTIVRLTSEEQFYVTEALRRFRKKQVKQAASAE